jgi:Nucleotidyltransferase of unknown function (DUF6036)
MNDLLETAQSLQAFCDRQGWSLCIIGGIAIQRWGEPRVTRDVNVTLLTGFGDEDKFIRVLLEQYPARITNPGEFARKNRVLLLQTPAGVGLDVSLGALPFEQNVVEHATTFEYAPGLKLRTCSAEDLIVMKLFASRPIDLQDAEGVVIRNRPQLNWSYIQEQLQPLADAKEEPEIMDELARLRGIS